MTDKNDKKQPPYKDAITVKEVHIHCGTPKCCGECVSISTTDSNDQVKNNDK